MGFSFWGVGGCVSAKGPEYTITPFFQNSCVLNCVVSEIAVEGRAGRVVFGVLKAEAETLML